MPRLGPSRQHATHGPAQESKNNRPEGRSSHRPEGLAEEEHRPLVDYFGPPLRPERSLRTPAASGRLLRSEDLAQALLPTLTPRLQLECAETLLTALLRLARPEPTGTIRPGTPARKESGDERRKQARAHKSNHDTRDHTLYTCRNSTLQPP